MPLYFVNQNWLVKPNVKGFGYSPLYMHPWRQVSIQLSHTRVARRAGRVTLGLRLR